MDAEIAGQSTEAWKASENFLTERGKKINLKILLAGLGLTVAGVAAFTAGFLTANPLLMYAGSSISGLGTIGVYQGVANAITEFITKKR